MPPRKPCGDWLAYLRCLQDGRIAYHPEALNCHRQSSGSVTDVGERGTAMLAEALRIKSVLWTSSSLSDLGRVLGLAQLLVEAAVRADRELEVPFVKTVAVAWEAAVVSNGPPLILMGFRPVSRLRSASCQMRSGSKRHSSVRQCSTPAGE